MKKRVLFLIHDLGQGGAEKVLINLVNNIDKNKFDVTVLSLFAGGINERFLADDVHYKTVFRKMIPGNSKLMILCSPEYLHKRFISEVYDIEISYLEGPCARIISGCKNPNTKLVSWIHFTAHSKNDVCKSFRSFVEAKECYQRFDIGVFVSEDNKRRFLEYINFKQSCVLYNTNETSRILQLAKESIDNIDFSKNHFSLIGVGKLEKIKGFDRLIRIHKELSSNGKDIKTYILGKGSEEESLRQSVLSEGLESSIVFLGYQTNPYKYISKCDLFVCCSHSEGFSTAATEALIVGTPVCTVDVSGMKEMLGENNEYGLITENNEEALYQGIKSLLDDPNLLLKYREKAKERGSFFRTENTVKAVESKLFELLEN